MTNDTQPNNETALWSSPTNSFRSFVKTGVNKLNRRTIHICLSVNNDKIELPNLCIPTSNLHIHRKIANLY